jgi:hypothetical protein
MAGNCESGDCPEVYYASDITSDVAFNTIVVPPGSTLDEVLVIMETYFNETLLDLENDLFVLTEPNCLSLAAGSYSYQQIVSAVITVLCALKTFVEELDSNDIDLSGTISVPSCLTPFTGTTVTALLNAIMTKICAINALYIPITTPYSGNDIANLVTLDMMHDIHKSYADNDSYVYEHTTVVTSPTALSITVQPMKAVVIDYPIKRTTTEVFALTPNKDIYFTLDDKAVVSKIEQTIGNPAPSMTSKVYLYKIVTDGVGVVSYTEEFETTPFVAPSFTLADDSVTTSKILNLNVTGAKMENIVAGATKGAPSLIEITYDAKGRITGCTSLLSLVGLADGMILKYNAASTRFEADTNLSVGTDGFLPLASSGDFIASNISENATHVTSAKSVEINSGVAEANAQAGLNVVTGTFMAPRYTAIDASALTVTDATLIYVTSTNGTFTSVGFWGVENSIWVKL